MRNKEKYDLNELRFYSGYSSYLNKRTVQIRYKGDLIADIAGNGYDELNPVMRWLEQEVEK